MKIVGFSVIPDGKNNDEIPLDLYFSKKRTNKVVLFAGGDGDTKDVWNDLIMKLSKNLSDFSFATFDYSYLRNPKKYGMKQNYLDLVAVVEFLVNKSNDDIRIVATSMGAGCTCQLLADESYAKKITKVVFLDPADYYIDSDLRKKLGGTWSGSDTFKPEGKLYSNYLKVLNSTTLVDVVFFNLKNRGEKGYIDSDYLKRGIDNKNGYTRLNNEMVENFYQSAPKRNRGEYKEAKLPHGLFRDGDVEKNLAKLDELLVDLLAD